MRTFTGLALLGVAVVPALAVELEVIDAADHHQIVAQNEFLRLMVVPEQGGRIMSLVDRGIEAELIWTGEGQGGALDDRDDFTAAAYSYRTSLSDDTSQAVITVAGEALGGYRITKVLVIRDGSPAIEQRITVVNASQRPRAFWQRCFFRPAGRDLSEDATYFLPKEDGVVAIPDLHGRHQDFTAAWSGVIDGASGHGILVVGDLDFIEQFYYWRGSPISATFEWICATVPPGQQVSSRLWIVLTSDVDAYSDEVVAQYVGRTWWSERDGLQFAEVPGWVDRRLKVEPDEQQLARGFTIYRAWGDDPGSQVTELDMSCPLGGTDSLTLQVAAFKGVEMKVQLAGEGATAFRAYYVDDDRSKLMDLDRLALKQEDVRQLQLVLDGASITEPGIVSATLVATGAGGSSQRIALRGRVWPLRLPDRRLVMMKAYGGSLYMFAGGPVMEPANLERLAFYLDDGSMLGQSVAEIALNPNQALDTVRLRERGQTLREAAAADSEVFADLDSLPALDFSYFNPWVHGALLHGYRWAETHGPPLQRWTTTALVNVVAGRELEPGSDEFRKIYVWYLSELGRWLVGHGYPEVFCKVSDEISPDAVPGWIEVAALCKQAGMRPYTTITGGVARTPSLLNAMNPVADGWQIQLLSTQVFRDLTTQRYVIRTETRDITKEKWNPYGNGGAENTYACRPFEAIQGVSAGDVSEWQATANGEPLQKKGSPWGNKTPGMAALLSPTLYVSLPDSSDPRRAGHRIELEYTVRRLDPQGELLLNLDDSDTVTFYGGGSKPFRIPYGNSRRYGWFAAAKGYPAYGWWAYAHGWHATEHIVFREDGNSYRTPCWWGLRDGNQDADLYYLAEAMIRRAEGQRPTDQQRRALDEAKATVTGLVGTTGDHILKLEAGNYSGVEYFFLKGEEEEAAFRAARQRVLQTILDVREGSPDVNFAPDLYWGELLIIASGESMHDLEIVGPEQTGEEMANLLREAVAAARTVSPKAAPASDKPNRAPVRIFIGLPSAERLEQVGLDAEQLALSAAYPGAGDFVILRGSSGGQPCVVIIGGDTEGGLLGARCFAKLLTPRW